MINEELKAILTEIKEFFQNDLQNSEGNFCVGIYRGEIEKILYKDSFLTCDAIRVFLLFNCTNYDMLELKLKPLYLVRKKWVKSLYETTQEAEKKKKKKLEEELLKQIKEELNLTQVISTFNAENKPQGPDTILDA